MKRLTIQVFAVVGTVIGLTPSIRSAAADQPKIITFDVPGSGTKAGQGTRANGINLVGTIAGTYADASGVTHG
jgi:hypothetical protein